MCLKYQHDACNQLVPLLMLPKVQLRSYLPTLLLHFISLLPRLQCAHTRQDSPLTRSCFFPAEPLVGALRAKTWKNTDEGSSVCPVLPLGLMLRGCCACKYWRAHHDLQLCSGQHLHPLPPSHNTVHRNCTQSKAMENVVYVKTALFCL